MARGHSKPRYAKIRAKLAEFGMDYAEFGRAIGLSKTSVALRMVGKLPWSDFDQYRVLDLFGIPDDQKHIIFPRTEGIGGKEA